MKIKDGLEQWNETQRKARLKYANKLKGKPRNKIRRKKKGSLSYWKAKAITEAKRVARSIGYCEKCYGTENLQGSHIIAVGNSTLIAADVDNILCLCWHDHLGNGGWHLDPSANIDWFDAKWPGRRKMLQERADRMRNAPTKPTAEDWHQKYLELLGMTRQDG